MKPVIVVGPRNVHILMKIFCAMYFLNVKKFDGHITKVCQGSKVYIKYLLLFRKTSLPMINIADEEDEWKMQVQIRSLLPCYRWFNFSYFEKKFLLQVMFIK